MTPEQIATLPDDLLSARHCIDIGAYWNTGLVDLAAQRICDLEAEVIGLRKALYRQKDEFYVQLAEAARVVGQERDR